MSCGQGRKFSLGWRTEPRNYTKFKLGDKTRKTVQNGLNLPKKTKFSEFGGDKTTIDLFTALLAAIIFGARPKTPQCWNKGHRN